MIIYSRKVGYIKETYIAKQVTQGLIEVFLELFAKLIENINDNLSDILKIVLKLLHYAVIEDYKIDQNNYYAIYTLLMFSFLIMSKVQDMYDVSQHEYASIKDFNRIIRVFFIYKIENICYNKTFEMGDTLALYNEIIAICHIKLNLLIQKVRSHSTYFFKVIISLNDDKCEEKVSNILSLVIQPPFLFYFDCSYLMQALQYKYDVPEEEISPRRNTEISLDISFGDNSLEAENCINEKRDSLNSNENRQEIRK